MIFIFRDPSARLLQGSQKVSKNFLGRGAAGAAGKAASIARRLPWRLASDELRMTEEQNAPSREARSQARTPPHGRRIHKQKRPLTGGASTSKNAPLREARPQAKTPPLWEARFLPFRKNFQAVAHVQQPENFSEKVKNAPPIGEAFLLVDAPPVRGRFCLWMRLP